MRIQGRPGKVKENKGGGEGHPSLYTKLAGESVFSLLIMLLLYPKKGKENELNGRH